MPFPSRSGQRNHHLSKHDYEERPGQVEKAHLVAEKLGHQLEGLYPTEDKWSTSGRCPLMPPHPLVLVHHKGDKCSDLCSGGEVAPPRGKESQYLIPTKALEGAVDVEQRDVVPLTGQELLPHGLHFVPPGGRVVQHAVHR